MATETVVIKVVGDAKGITKTVDELERLGKVDSKVAKKFGDNQKRTKGLIEDTEKALKDLKRARDKSQDTKSIERFNKKIKEAEFDLKKLKTTGTEAFKKVGKEIKKTEKKAGLFSKSILKIGGLIATAFAVGQLVSFGKEAVKAFDIQEKAEKRLLVALGGRESVQKELIKQAKEMQETTIFADEDVIAAQALIGAFTNEKETIEELTRVTLDFATAKGFALPAAAELVSKTFASSTNSLTRYGIQVEGAAGSSQRLESITKNLDSAFGGQAEAATAGAGKLQQLHNAWGDLKEQIGGLIVEGITPFVDGLGKMVSSASLYLQTPLSEELEKEQTNVNALVMELTDANTSQDRRNQLIAILQKEYPSLLKNIKAEGDFTEQLKNNLAAFNTEASKRIVFEKKREGLLDVLTTKAQRERELDEERAGLREELIEINLRFFKGQKLIGNTAEEQAEFLKNKLIPLVKEEGESRKEGGKILNAQGVAIGKLDVALNGIGFRQTALNMANKIAARETENYKDTVDQLNISLDKEGEIFEEINTTVAETTGTAKRAETEMEKLRRTISELNKELLEQALAGNISEGTMAALATATEKLSDAEGNLNAKLFIQSQLRKGLKADTPDIKTTDAIDTSDFRKIEKNEQDNADKLEAQRKENQQIAIDNGIAAVNAGLEAVNILYQGQSIEIENEFAKRQSSLDKQLARGAISEAQFAKKSEELAKSTDKKRKELQKKQAIAQKANAIFEAGINTAVAVTKMLTAGPVIGQVLAGIAAAAGIAQIAFIAAAPIPEFAKGTKDAPGGVARIGEQGEETMFVPEGAKILSNPKTIKNAALIDAMIDDNVDNWVMKNYSQEPFAGISQSVEYNFDTYPITRRQNQGNQALGEINHNIKQLLNQNYNRVEW